MKRIERKGLVKQVDDALAEALPLLERHLKVIASGTAVAVRKGNDLVPEADFALAVRRDSVEGLAFTRLEIPRREALRYLSKEAIVLPDAPRGYLLLSCEGQDLGFVKNLGARTNSLLPASRRIRMQNTDNSY